MISGSVIEGVRERAHSIVRSRFVRNVAAVATGFAAAQAISLAFYPFLTRLYGPEAFGALAAFAAVVNILTPLATLGYAHSIVMPATEHGATAVARLSLACAAVVAPVVLALVHIFITPLSMWTGLEDNPGLLYLIPVSLLLVALLTVANQTAIREGLFKAKAGSHVASNLLMNTGKLIGGLLAPSGLLLIIISTAGNAFNFVMLLSRVPRQGAFKVRRWFGLDGIRPAALEQLDFAIYRMPQSVIKATALGMPVIALSAFFDSGSAGQYAITVLMLGAPAMLLGQSVGDVFFPRVTRAIEARKLSAVASLRKATAVLAILALVPYGTVVVAGPMIFPFVFGEEWSRAGEYAQWISIWLFGVLVSQACLAAFPALKLQKFLLFQEVVGVILRAATLYAGFSVFQSDLVAVALFSLVGLMLTSSMCVCAFVRLHRLDWVRT